MKHESGKPASQQEKSRSQEKGRGTSQDKDEERLRKTEKSESGKNGGTSQEIDKARAMKRQICESGRRPLSQGRGCESNKQKLVRTYVNTSPSKPCDEWKDETEGKPGVYR